MTMPPPSRGSVRRAMGAIGEAGRAAPGGAPRTACTAFWSTFTSTVRTRSGSVRIVATEGARPVSIARPGSAILTAAAASRQIAFGSASCHEKAIGFA